MANLPQEVQGTLGASAPGTAGYNPAWYAAGTIFIDPVAGSDAAAGTSSGAPIKTWAEAVRRWGSNSPLLNVTTVVTFLSNQADNTDPVIWQPFCAAGARAQIQGTTPAATAAVFTRTAQKNRTAGANSVLAGSFSAGVLAPGVMIQNTTAGKSSRAFIYKTAGGANWNLSQPFALQTPPSITVPTEVDTWASTDTVNVLAPVQINIAYFCPVLVDFDLAADNLGTIYQCVILDPNGLGFDACYVNGAVQLQEVMCQRFLTTTELNPFEALTLNNVAAGGGIIHDIGVVSMNGGYVQSALQGLATLELDGDAIIGSASFPFFFGASHLFGLVFLDTLATFSGGNAIFRTIGYGSHVIYGGATGQFEFGGATHGVLNSGTYTAGWTAPLLVTGVALNGAASGNSAAYAGAVATIHNGIATSVANLDAAAGAAGFGGVAFNLGGSSISNLA